MVFSDSGTLNVKPRDSCRTDTLAVDYDLFQVFEQTALTPVHEVGRREMCAKEADWRGEGGGGGGGGGGVACLHGAGRRLHPAYGATPFDDAATGRSVEGLLFRAWG